MATTLFVNGLVTPIPGSYSEIDASGLESTGLGANGIVAVLGTAVGGRPASSMTEPSEFLRILRPESARKTFKSGDLREASSMIFEPSTDPQILAGAQEVVAMKVNPATQSSATFSNGDGTVVTATSVDYGAFTSQTTVSIATGTVKGKLITIVFEAQTEALDNVGGDNIFSLKYTAPGGDGGWEAMRAQVLSSGVRAYGSRTDIGQATQVLVPITVGENIRITATASDVGKVATVFGRNTSNVPVKESLVLVNGNVSGTQLWNAVYAVRLDAVAVGTVTVEEDAGAFPDLLVVSATQQERGMVSPTAMYVDGSTLSLAADAATTDEVHVWGKNAVGAEQAERIILNGATNVVTVGSWSEVQFIILGGLAVARTLTVAGDSAQTSNLVQNKLSKIKAYFDARQPSATTGFIFTILTGNSEMASTSLDLTSGLGPDVFTAAQNFTANLQTILDSVNLGGTLVALAKIAFAPMVRDVTVAAVVNSFAYTITVNGITVTYTSDASATAAEIQAGLVAAVNAHPGINVQATAANSAVSDIRITAATPLAYSLAVSANLATVFVSDTAGAGYQPNNTTQPTALAGGSEGTTTFANWQSALNLLKKVRVNSVVALTGDPAVHAAVEAHCAFMCGFGRSERDAFVGLSALDGQQVPLNTLPTKTSIKDQIVNINSRHVRAFAQTVDRFDTFGESTTYLPWFQGVIAAGMQAGSSVGTSLTHKFAKVTDISQHSSWNSVDDAAEMIQGGLCFMEFVDGVGRRFVRNVTTHLSSNNLAFIEGSVNNAVNFATFNFRNAMEFAVGRKGFLGTVNAAKGIAVTTLGLLVESGAITAWRALTLSLNADVLEISVELAPVIPINFVKTTIHLVTIQTLAS